MTVSRKLLTPVLAFFALVMVGLIGVFSLEVSTTMRAEEERDLERLLQTFLGEVNSLESLALGLATQVANDAAVQEAFAAGDRLLLIKLTQPAFQQIAQQLGVTQHGFHVAPAKSFLRLHRLDAYGDDLAQYRFTVLDANLDRRPISGLEIGRDGLGVRGVVPVTSQGRHIGTVEYGLNAGDALLGELRERTKVDWQLFLLRDAAELVLFDDAVQVDPFADSDTWQDGPTDELLLHASTMEMPVFAAAGAYAAALRDRPQVSRISSGGRDYAILSSALYDWNNQVIGVIEVLLDRTERLAGQQQRVALAVVVALTSLLIGGGGLVLIATRILRPVGVLTETATEIAAGDLGRRVNIKSRDEIGRLAHAFNSMTGQLRELVGGLELRVVERTRELEASTENLAAQSAELEAANRRMAEINQHLEEAVGQSQRRAALLQAGVEVSRAAAEVRDLDELLPEVTRLISEHFGFYHAGIFMLDETGQHAVLCAASSEGGQRMLARGHKLRVGEEGIIGHVTATCQPRVSLDVGADATFFDNPDLPETRSEMAVPLRIGEEVIGALDVQSTQEAAFDSEDVAVLVGLADQVVTAIQNARLFQRTREAMAQSEEAQRRYMRQEWSRFLRRDTASAYEYTVSGTAPAGLVNLPEIALALEQENAVVLDHTEHPLASDALAVPIKFRGHVMGALSLHASESDREWSEDELSLIQEVAEQIGLALENARLFADTERRAHREALIGQIVSQVRLRSDVDGIMQTAVRELGKALGAPRTYLRLTGVREPQIAQEVSDDGN